MTAWISGFPRRTMFVWDPAQGSSESVYAGLVEQGWESDYGSPPEGVWAFVNGRDRLAWAMRETEATRVAREAAESQRRRHPAPPPAPHGYVGHVGGDVETDADWF